MSTVAVPTRLILCVDGTWCTPDGAHGSQHNNISNVYRLCASTKVGLHRDNTSGITYNQRKQYFNGIGSEKNIAWLKRLEVGAFGTGFQKQIREVYEECCLVPDHPQSEIWLYGFSRGAYVVRAVASLLHYIRSLTSAGTPGFQNDYRQALEKYSEVQRTSKLKQSGQIHQYIAASTREAPKIRFVGVFDTVKAVNDHSLYEISFNDSIQHLRHALALNENRKAMQPEYLFPDIENIPRSQRSIVQAWFVGAHIDIGGSAAKDGLSLYPLQWMLLESQSLGLGLRFDGSFSGRAYMDNPLNLVLPMHESDGKMKELHVFKATNGLTIQMGDIRHIHDPQHKEYGARYGIFLNQNHSSWMSRRDRQPFSEGGMLEGYCAFAPQGTVLHPSIYLVFDQYCHVFLDSRKLSSREHIEKWRPNILPKDGFWNDAETINIEDPGAVRILVCGNTGIGKSTLINAVFGAELTTSSDRSRGIHNIKDPITDSNRPNLILHDSGGFESGGTAALQRVKDFVRDLSNKVNYKDRLHVIWFCIEINSSRTQQVASKELFKTLSQHAEVPIVIIGTKKDQFWNMQYGEARDQYADQNALEGYCNMKLRDRMYEIESEQLAIEGGRYDAIVAVSMNDKESISALIEKTSSCFDNERVRQLYVAAQVTHIDLKIDLAVAQTMKIYKRVVRSAATVASIPTASNANRITMALLLSKAIVGSFGTSNVSARTVQEILKNMIWDEMGHNVAILFAEFTTIMGIGGFLITGAPIFLVSIAVNVPFVVPATARLCLLLASDLILILSRAYRASTNKFIGQPQKKDIEDAAREYRNYVKAVHRDGKKLVPNFHVIKSFRNEKIRLGLEEIIGKHKKIFVEQVIPREEIDAEAFDSEDSDITKVGFDGLSLEK